MIFFMNTSDANFVYLDNLQRWKVCKFLSSYQNKIDEELLYMFLYLYLNYKWRSLVLSRLLKGKMYLFSYKYNNCNIIDLRNKIKRNNPSKYFIPCLLLPAPMPACLAGPPQLATQSSNDAKLLLLPPQPPYVNNRQLPNFLSK